jgi:hypothetical protein
MLQGERVSLYDWTWDGRCDPDCPDGPQDPDCVTDPVLFNIPGIALLARAGAGIYLLMTRKRSPLIFFFRIILRSPGWRMLPIKQILSGSLITVFQSISGSPIHRDGS